MVEGAALRFATTGRCWGPMADIPTMIVSARGFAAVVHQQVSSCTMMNSRPRGFCEFDGLIFVYRRKHFVLMR